MRESKLDSIFGRFAQKAGDNFTRRSWLYRMGERACLLVGVSFSSLVVVETGINLAGADEPNNEAAGKVVKRKTVKTKSTSTQGQGGSRCQHGNDCTQTGRHCGLNGVLCSGYVACSGCLNTSGPDRGCPKGTRRGASWQYCCRCSNNTQFGEVYRYYDCCGGPLDPACDGCQAANGCSNGQRCSGFWCGDAGFLYQCSISYNTRQICGPGAGSKGVVKSTKPLKVARATTTG